MPFQLDLRGRSRVRIAGFLRRDTLNMGHENLSIGELVGDLVNGWAIACNVVFAVANVAGRRQLGNRRELPVGVW